MEPFSFSQQVNRFIEGLEEHNECIEVIRVSDKETIIFYESYDKEPIKNYNSGFKEYRRSAQARANMGNSRKGKTKSAETKDKISKSMKKRQFTDLQRARIAAGRNKMKDGQIGQDNTTNS